MAAAVGMSSPTPSPSPTKMKGFKAVAKKVHQKETAKQQRFAVRSPPRAAPTNNSSSKSDESSDESMEEDSDGNNSSEDEVSYTNLEQLCSFKSFCVKVERLTALSSRLSISN